MEKITSSDNELESNDIEKPSSPCIPISQLITMLSKSLSLEKLHELKKIYEEFKEKKCTRLQMVDHVKMIVEDNGLLISAIKCYNKKLMEATITSKLGKLNRKA